MVVFRRIIRRLGFSAAPKPPSAAPTVSYLISRWLFLLTLLAIELEVITAWFEVPLTGNETRGSAWLFAHSKEIWHIALWSIGTVFLIFSLRPQPLPHFQRLFSELQNYSRQYRWIVWLGYHLLALIGFVVVTTLIFQKPTVPARLSAAWFTVWFVLASATFFLWLLAVAPIDFWLRLLRQERAALSVGVLLGLAVWVLVGMLVRQEAPLAQLELWNVLSNLTLQLVHGLLAGVYSDLVYEPETSVVGTASFYVEISYACSGVEGMSLITVFLSIYLWAFRDQLRFPQAFWLIPLGIIAIWLANAVRIAGLILIGTFSSPQVALQGFHAHGGWIAFILIAFGAIALSHRRWFLSAAGSGPPVTDNSSPLATALLVPLMVWIGASMGAAAFSTGFDWLYPLGVIAATATLWHYRQAYRSLGWRYSWTAIGIGVAVFGLWLLLEPAADSRKTQLALSLAEISAGPAAIWLVFRVFGSVLIVPLVEELAFRGYILRKLIARDFEKVSFTRFTWFSFLVSSVLFGLLHGRWLAGTLAGMAYALALRRRGQLGDAVLAHGTTNALIAGTVLAQERWALWS